MTKIKITEPRELTPMIENIVERKLIEFLGDPDSELVLTVQAKKRLAKSFKSKTKNISAVKAAQALGLKW